MTWTRNSLSKPIESRFVYGVDIDNNSDILVIIAVGHNVSNTHPGTFVSVEDGRYYPSRSLPTISQVRWLFPGLDKLRFYETSLILQDGSLGLFYYVSPVVIPHNRYVLQERFDSVDINLNRDSADLVKAIYEQTHDGYDFTSEVENTTQHTLEFLRAAESDGYEPSQPYKKTEYANGGHDSEHW
jgi:hypothetical protein